MQTEIPFRISTHLKDIIGRDLVTNEFVAIFELVKNSFDAGATTVHIEFDPESDQLTIVDNGKGMSDDDIKSKWLFLAYSAKADGTEDIMGAGDYRDRIRTTRTYAGSKGIGRFSCDTLGRSLDLYSRVGNASSPVHSLKVNWLNFEKDSKKEFSTVNVTLDEHAGFPKNTSGIAPNSSGTILEIKRLRHEWDEKAIEKLRRYLAKLIDPFGTTSDVEVSTTLVGSDPTDLNVNGPISNDIADILKTKTSRIEVEISEGGIRTVLVDRGRLIYEIHEPSPYEALANVSIKGQIFFLNRSAKQTFSTRMKVRPVDFGNIFLFLNGFRVFPIGEEFDDTFGLARRKQQGTARFLGTRDVLGRVDVSAQPRVFREASSRDAGLIEDARSRELYEAIRKNMVFRLERYVVGVNWKDKPDQFRETPEGLESDPAKRRILQIIGGLARSKDVDIVRFDQNIVDLADAREEASRKALSDLSAIAERDGDVGLLKRIEETRARIEELERSEQEAQEEARRLAAEQAKSDSKIVELEKQARFLASSQDLDAERIQLLLHQVNIYSGHIDAGARRAVSTAGNLLERLLHVVNIEPEDVEDFAGYVRHNLTQVMDDLSYVLLENDRLQSVSRFAPNIRVDLETNEVTGDVVGFLSEYFAVMLSDGARQPQVTFEPNGLSLECSFSPFDFAVILDNLVDNARKAKAKVIHFDARKAKGGNKVLLHVSDDGVGMDVERMDPARIFAKHYSATHGGSGLGLFHVRQILEKMGGSIELAPDADVGRADFVISIPGASK